MRTVILHPANKIEFNFLVALLERLKIPFDVREELTEVAEEEDSINKLYGSWESEEKGEELIEQIYSARMDAPREVSS